MDLSIIPRSEWGARYSDGAPGVVLTKPWSEWWLHHSITVAPDLVPPFTDEYAAMRTLEDIGQQRFGQGISYTFPIMPNGRVYQGHSSNRRGAHTGGRNDVSRAICLVGNYDVLLVSEAQIESAAQLMVQEYRAGRATRYTLNGGHQQLKATSCPGRNGMAAIPLINARATALMNGAPSRSPIVTVQEDDMPYTLITDATGSNPRPWWVTDGGMTKRYVHPGEPQLLMDLGGVTSLNAKWVSPEALARIPVVGDVDVDAVFAEWAKLDAAEQARRAGQPDGAPA